jgi:hypothetical protein
MCVSAMMKSQPSSFPEYSKSTQLGTEFLGTLDRIFEFDIFCIEVRQSRYPVTFCQSDHSDLVASMLDDRVVQRTCDVRAINQVHVGQEPRKLAHLRQLQRLFFSEVQVVVSDTRGVSADVVHDADHLLSLFDYRYC